MNQLTISQRPQAFYLSEQRKFERREAIHLLAITERGTGRILDFSSEGFSFGCLYPHTFPAIFFVDILDAKGSHIKKIQVRKIWETNGNYLSSSAAFELMVGVEFIACTEAQKDELEYLLEALEEDNSVCSYLI